MTFTLDQPLKYVLKEVGTVPFCNPPVISTKQKSEPPLRARRMEVLSDKLEGLEEGFVHVGDCQLKRNTQLAMSLEDEQWFAVSTYGFPS